MPLFIGHSKNTKSEHLLSGILKKPGPSHPGYIVNSIHVSKERKPNEAYKTAMAIFFWELNNKSIFFFIDKRVIVLL
jgi:hypothetical protein